MAPTLVTRPAQTITVPSGATVASLSKTYHVDSDALRWANNLEDGTEPIGGTPLLLPPGPGALVKVRAGERPSQFAARLHIDPRVLLDYNGLTDDSARAVGTYLQVPLLLAPVDALAAANVVPVAQGIPGVPASQGSHGGDDFPYGQCTWYVASRRKVSWNGDAWQWWSNAHGIRPEGHTPISGAIVVMDNGWAGHVALVERVNSDGSFVISEMNYFGNGGGWGRVDRRTLSPNDPWILGYIY